MENNLGLGLGTGVALDLAPTHSGIVVSKDTEIVETNRVEASGWQAMAIKIIATLEQDYPLVDWVAIEGAHYRHNKKVYGDLCRLIGSITTHCKLKWILVFEGQTTEIDSACNIPHKNRKGHIASLVDKMLPENNLSEDEYDAVAVSVWGQGKYKEHLWKTLSEK